MSTPEERIKLWRQEQGAAERRRIWAQERQGAQQPPQDEGYYAKLKRNLGIGARRGILKLGSAPGAAGAEILSGIGRGDFGPLKEAVELTGRSALSTIGKVSPGMSTLMGDQSARIAELQQQQAARRATNPNFVGIGQELARLDTQAALDPSLTGKITRGGAEVATSALPAVATGVATGGSLPAIGIMAGMQSLDQPANLPLNVGLSVAPLPVGQAVRAGRNMVRKVFGKGAADIIEAEARQAAAGIRTSGVAPAVEMEAAPTLRAIAPTTAGQIRAVGAAAEAPAIRAASASLPVDSLNAAIQSGAKELPPLTVRRALGELASFPRAMMSSLDISAPARQGAILSFAPSRWPDAIKASARMFQAFSPRRYKNITDELAKHADAPVAQDSGLYLAFREAEEYFSSRLAARIPGVQASQRAFETYLDSMRMSVFSSYKKLIDKQGLDVFQKELAYKRAAEWVNIATGRGSLGRRFDKSTELLSQFLFAPRYAASRINVLNPAMYWRNARDPATRAVFKQQMRDLGEYLGVVGVTLGLAKLGGADVNLNPTHPDFAKIKIGRHRYDLGAGLTQVLRFAARTSADLFRASKGETAERGQDAGSVLLKFLRSKAAPIPSYVWDFATRRTYSGRKFTATEAGRGVLERVVPLMWSDFTEALLNEGLGSAAMTLPGGIGIGVQSFGDDATDAAVEKLQPLLIEYKRFKHELPEVRKLKDESDGEFEQRRQVYGEGMTAYGLGLLNSPEYRGADEATKEKALELLPDRISTGLLREGQSWMLRPNVLVHDAKVSLQSQQQRGPRKLYNAQGRRLR